MEKRTWTITLADGTTLEGLTLNGNNYVSGNPLTEADFAGKLGHVTISDGEITTVMEHAVLVQCKKYDKEYWFVLRELSAEELMAAKTQANIEYIAMMADIDLEEV